MMSKKEQLAFELGSKAGAVFADNVYESFKEFISRYDSSEPGFNEGFYVEGFLRTFRNNLDIDDLAWEKVND
jgi:hypothetical protein